MKDKNCIWELTDDNPFTYNPECQGIMEFYFSNGKDYYDNNFVYCPYCGKKIGDGVDNE